MKLYNPTEDVVEEGFNGFMFVVGPGATKDVSDDCGKHMIRKKAKCGLVVIDYGEKEEKAFGSISKYKEQKRTEGLKAYLENLKEQMNKELMFPREVAMKNGGEVEQSNTQVPFFKNKIKEVETLLSPKPSAILTVPVAEKKKMGRPPRKAKVEDVRDNAVTA